MESMTPGLAFACRAAIIGALVVSVEVAASAEEASPAASTGELFRIEKPGFRIAGKNLSQRDDQAWSFEDPFAWKAGIKGSGFVSLGDPNGGRQGARNAANFNSIINEVQIDSAEQVVIHAQRRRVQEPPPERLAGESDEALRKRVEAWKAATDEQRKAIARDDATRFTAFEGGLHARAESNQDFRDTQFALGAHATLASGRATNTLLSWARFLIPADPYDPKGIGRIFQSPQLFAGVDAVLGADQRSAIDGTTRDTYARLRFEAAWETELLLRGLWPYVSYQLYHEIDAPSAIRTRGKQTTQFVEVGARYFLAGGLGILSEVVDANRGPFVTIKYTAGELPPYLETDHQVSLGFGLDF
jgi:hypothetical protein